MLLESSVHSNPVTQFLNWYQETVDSGLPFPDAMTLATANRKGVPSARIVLYKGWNAQGICFFTNYESRKGKELMENPVAALVFFWPQLERQVRIEGKIKQVSEEESDSYWASRPHESQISALASKQSSTVESRKDLEEKVEKLQIKYQNQAVVPRPAHWGGFCLIPERIEFWQNRENRLHDRILYTRKQKKWEISRLSP